MDKQLVYKRILLKISGEALAGPANSGLDTNTFNYLASELSQLHAAGVQVAIVVGGGNYIRGSEFSKDSGIDPTIADQMGMLGTIINALAIQSSLEKHGMPTRVQSAIDIPYVSERFIRRRAIRHLEKGRVVVFAAGTGNPYFTTDTAAALRALEIEADCIVKATKVDGIYDKDPLKHHDAIKFDHVEYRDAIIKRLAVMDQTAFTMCEEHNIPIIVLNFNQSGVMLKAAFGSEVGTLVGENHV